VNKLCVAALAFAAAACSDPAPPPAPPPPAAPAPGAAAEPAKPPAKAAQAEAAKPDPNERLAAQVKRALEAERDLGAEGIDVTVSAGVAQLFGTVESAAKRKRAEALAAAVPGVTAVQNKLQIVKGS
jgi:hypothetical protein